jgi:hypothetical protein
MKSTENLVKYWLKLLIVQGDAFERLTARKRVRLSVRIDFLNFFLDVSRRISSEKY